MAASVRKSERGFTLVEILVSLAIVFIVFIGLAETGLFALEQNILNTMRDEGTRIAEAEASQVRAIPYTAVDAWGAVAPFDYSIPVRGLTVTYNVTRNVVALNADNRQVTITVVWSRKGRTYNHQVMTIVRSHG